MNANVQESREEEIDVLELVARVWARRWWVVASVVLFSGLFIAFAYLSTPIYRASTVIIPANDQAQLGGALSSALGSLGGLASLAGAGLPIGGGRETEEALAVLKSREFTEAFIKDLGLMPVLFESRWDAKTNSWIGDDEPPTLAQAYKVFDRAVRRVTQDKKTGLITLQIDWRDREQAAQWANLLVDRLNAEMRTRAIASASAAVHYLESELKGTALVGTREAINRLIESQIKQRMLANVSREYAFRVVDKALPPDKRDRLKPNKLVLVAAGPVVGAMFGVIGVLLFGWLATLVHALRARPGSVSGVAHERASA